MGVHLETQNPCKKFVCIYIVVVRVANSKEFEWFVRSRGTVVAVRGAVEAYLVLHEVSLELAILSELAFPEAIRGVLPWTVLYRR